MIGDINWILVLVVGILGYGVATPITFMKFKFLGVTISVSVTTIIEVLIIIWEVMF